MRKIIFIAVTVIGTLSVSAQKTKNHIDTLTVTTTPQMHCSGCENKIKQNIRFVKGTKKILTSVPKQEVTIIYDKRKASEKDYATAFSKIGYEIKTKK